MIPIYATMRIADTLIAWRCPQCGRKQVEAASLTGVLGTPVCHEPMVMVVA